MHTLSAATLLDAWEAGLSMDSHNRALLLLSITLPEADERQMGTFSMGERDYHLFQLRQMLFGSRLVNVAQCPHCQERLEWESDCVDLCGTGMDKYPPEYPLVVQDGGLQVHFRLPGIQEVAWLQQQGIMEPQSLLQQCVMAAFDTDGETLTVAQLPDSSLQALSSAMVTADPLARIDISLTCPACGHQWLAVFDVASFLWAEIQAWAERTLRSVHVLAKAYGWAEAEILAMTPTRRQLYLGMLAQ